MTNESQNGSGSQQQSGDAANQQQTQLQNQQQGNQQGSQQGSQQSAPQSHDATDGLADKKPEELTPEELRLMADTMPGEGPGD
ncbi:hypothetical protein G4G28_12830 [Massilia sp. Dwa41.01b]|uniref:hypothetical protein n=1 Tax=unclassified Massilia TaxID=2609279 RepID=UPI0015FF9BC8|nr:MULTISPECIES: hypothetical protein [unclassified Massilia]QNA89138.1 hypothetical protein G4G28_12830 [Massilia sp. Dwa41.01b]QNB00032.1 hypothetical protein G4G31_16405 [Massilia sp. Se16.2.3]